MILVATLITQPLNWYLKNWVSPIYQVFQKSRSFKETQLTHSDKTLLNIQILWALLKGQLISLRKLTFGLWDAVFSTWFTNGIHSTGETPRLWNEASWIAICRKWWQKTVILLMKHATPWFSPLWCRRALTLSILWDRHAYNCCFPSAKLELLYLKKQRST